MTTTRESDKKTHADFIAKHGELGRQLLKVTDNDLQEAERLMSECYQGLYESEQEHARFADEYGAELAEAVLEHVGNDLSEARCLMAENYQGAYDDKTDYAAEVFDEQVCMPDGLHCYIDYERFADHLFGCSDCFTIEVGDQTHVFKY